MVGKYSSEEFLKSLSAHDTNYGSDTWSARVRKTARELNQNTDRILVHLGQVLQLIWQTPSYGPTPVKPLYERWGYSTFADYCERELGISGQRGQRLRKVWYAINVQCQGIDEVTQQALIELGVMKLRLIQSRLDATNAAEWARIGRDLSYAELRDVFLQYKNGISLDTFLETESQNTDFKDMPDLVRRTPNPKESVPPSPVRDVTATVAASTERAFPTPPPGHRAEDDEPYQVDDEQRFQTEIFKLAVPQVEVLHQALDVVRKIVDNPHAKKGYCLDLICSEFLMNNSAVDVESSRKEFLTKIETASRIKVIAIDTQTGDIIHGLETLESLAKREL